MSEINNINGTQQIAPHLRLRMPVQGDLVRSREEASSDRVEISDAARFMGQMDDTPPIRYELVDRIRAEIEAGTFETADRINTTVDALLSELGH